MNEEQKFINWLSGVLDTILDEESVLEPDFTGKSTPYVRISKVTIDRIRNRITDLTKVDAGKQLLND